ncbi:MAG: DinB family protein [Chitinophagaceae bacterium]|nr:MAG: DinB family protein [Chitinophagaceae bacterium]
MEPLLKALKTSRKLYEELFDKYSLEQMNVVPDKYNNNIIWNIAHIIASQQSLVYKLSNLPMHISDDFFDRYKPGSRPLNSVSETEAGEIKSLLTSMIVKTETDLANGKFTSFTERNTLTGFHLGNLRDALVFTIYHEGLHMGVIRSIGRFV